VQCPGLLLMQFTDGERPGVRLRSGSGARE
jgi:hypothetical protein